MNRLLLVLSLFAPLLLAGCGAEPTSPDADAPAPDTAEAAAPAPAAESMPERSREPADVVGVTWEWVGTVTPVERIDVPEPGNYTVHLEPGGAARARFDCNRGTGSYEIGTGTIAFGPLAATRMACPEGSLDGRFMKDLGQVSSYFVEGGELYMELPVDSGTLRFRRAAGDAAAAE